MWKAVAPFLTGFFAGVLVWLLPPRVTNCREVWDGEYYVAILWITGLGLGLLFRHRWWLAYLGVVLGHLVATYATVILSESSRSSATGVPGGIRVGIAIPIWALAVIVLVYSLLTFVGALMGFGFRYALERLHTGK